MLDDGRVGEARVGAALLRRHRRVRLRQARARAPRRSRSGGRESAAGGRCPSRSTGSRPRSAARTGPSRLSSGSVWSWPKPVAEHRLAPPDIALDRLGVGVEQELGRVAALPRGRVVGAVHAEAVALAGPDARAGSRARCSRRPRSGRPVPRYRLRGPGGVEQAQLDLVGGLGVEGEVRAYAVVGRAERVADSWPRFPRQALLWAALARGRMLSAGCAPVW